MKTFYYMFVLLFVSTSLGSTQVFLNPSAFEVSHNRQDLNLEKLWIQTSCFSQDGSGSRNDCARVLVDGIEVDGFIEFLSTPSRRNSVLTKKLSITIDESSGKIFCIGMKVLFYGYPNQGDYVLYKNLDDRYSILSYCNIKRLPNHPNIRSRFSFRREVNWRDFANQFSTPIFLNLKSNMSF